MMPLGTQVLGLLPFWINEMAGMRDAATIPKAGLSVISLLNADPALRPQGSLAFADMGCALGVQMRKLGSQRRAATGPKSHAASRVLPNG